MAKGKNKNPKKKTGNLKKRGGTTPQRVKPSPGRKQSSPKSHPLTVVGVGASAGGLEAFKNLLRAIPENTGMAYVLVQHLHPKHESLLPEILSRSTKIPVRQIVDNVHIEPDHI